MIFPSLETILEKSKSYNLLPISNSFFADLETPISLFLKLKANYLLESVEKGSTVGRFSIIARGKKIEAILNQNEIKVTHFNPSGNTEEQLNLPNPLNYLQEWMQKNTAPIFEELPHYFGGWLGYLGHECISYFEPTTPTSHLGSDADDLQVPDGVLIFPELIVIYDNVLKKVWLIKLIDQSKNKLDQASLKQIYQETIDELSRLRQNLSQPLNYHPHTYSENTFSNEIDSTHDQQVTKKHSDEHYQDLVRKTKSYINQGEVIQTVLSNRFSIKAEIDPFEIYRTLKSQNPSPYLFYFDFDDFKLIGSSPEVMVMLMDDEILVKPIAGTRKRGKNVIEDEQLKNELLNDEKELAEHIMLVDLGRNDVSRVAEYGSVKVENYMNVEQYSQVQHIVSTVKGIKKLGLNAFDLIKATFPAGTLSGAPKIRAMQIIHELEQTRRGPYGGMVLFLSLSGDLNSCITIRTILQKNDELFIQAGAGIVQDSVPEKENEECLNKAAALIKAIKTTQARLQHDLND